MYNNNFRIENLAINVNFLRELLQSRICEFIKKFSNRQICTKEYILQLLEHFNCAMQVISSGRAFHSYLISTIDNDLKDKLYLTDEYRTYLLFFIVI